jgi:predicted O-methyltransferase YrrM
MTRLAEGIKGQALINMEESQYLLASIPEDQPFLFVEIGTFDGATAAFLAMNRPKATILSIDPFPIRTPESIELINPGDISHYMTNRCPNQLLFVGTAQDFVKVGSGAIANVVFIDGDHRTEAVYADMLSAKEMLRPGGFMMCHDYNRMRGEEEEVKPGVDRFCTGRGWHIADKCSTIVKVTR